MAAYTGSVTGNWADTATWGGSGPPVDGDSVTINTGITVTVATSTTATVGTAPDNVTTYDVLINGTGQLVINGTLNCKTNMDITGGGIVTVNGGGTLNFDASARPTTKEYRFRCGNSGTGRLVLNDNATVTAPSGSSWYQQSGSTSNAGQIDVNGTASNYAIIRRMQRSSSDVGWTVSLNVTSAGKYEMSHVIIDECDAFSFNGSGTFTILFEWCNWINSTAGTQNLILNTSSVTKQIRNCTFDRNPNSSGGWGTSEVINCQETYFDRNWTASGTTGGFPNSNWNVKRHEGTTNSPAGPCPFYPGSGGDLLTIEVLWKDAVFSNPHWGTAAALTGDRTLRGPIAISAGTASDGDVIQGSLASANTAKFEDWLFVPNANGNQPGTWLSAISSVGANAMVQYNHCTGVVSGTGTATRGVSVAEGTYNDMTGFVTALKSNLVFGGTDEPTDQQLFQVQTNAAHSQPDPLVPSGADYNMIVSTVVKTPAATYDSGSATITQTTPTAANDEYQDDVDFIDKGRSMPAWAQWWGTRIGASGDSTTTPGTAATNVNARLLLLAMHDGTFSETYTSTAMQLCCQYISRGYIPTLAAARVLGHDSKQIGRLAAWAPALSGLSASASGASCTTNAADGTLYWVLTSSATAPDWDRIIAGQDHTGASLPAAQKGSVAVSTTSPSWSYAPDPGTYYLHIVHSADATTNGDAGQAEYLRTSAETSSASFAVSAGGGGGTNRILTTVAVTRQWGGSRGRRAA